MRGPWDWTGANGGLIQETRLADVDAATRVGDSPTIPRLRSITDDFPPRVGGARSHYWGLIRTLDPSEVVVVAPDQPGGCDFDANHACQVLQLGHPLPAGLLGPTISRRIFEGRGWLDACAGGGACYSRRWQRGGDAGWGYAGCGPAGICHDLSDLGGRDVQDGPRARSARGLQPSPGSQRAAGRRRLSVVLGTTAPLLLVHARLRGPGWGKRELDSRVLWERLVVDAELTSDSGGGGCE